MTHALTLAAAGAAVLALAACERENRTASIDASLDRAIEEAKTPAPIPGAGVTVVAPQTGTMSSGTKNSDTAIGAPPRGTTGTNAHGGG